MASQNANILICDLNCLSKKYLERLENGGEAGVIDDALPPNIGTQTDAPENFDETLKRIGLSPGGVLISPDGCCPDLTTIPCDPAKARKLSEESAGAELKNALQNIVNAGQPGYKRFTSYRLPNGQYIQDDSPGALLKSDSPLDLAIDGPGPGFRLEDGSFTRNGKFRYDHTGRLVSEVGVPLSVCYADGAPLDWSLKKIRVDSDGSVYDRLDGRKLGTIELNIDETSRVRQGYTEISNVNMAMEFAEFASKFRKLEINTGIATSNVRLNGEAIQLLRNL